MADVPEAVRRVAEVQQRIEDEQTARETAQREKHAREIAAFQATGIAEMWEQLTTYCDQHDITAPHWRDTNLERIALSDHLHAITARSLTLVGPAGVSGESWWVRETPQGAMEYHIRYVTGGTQSFREPEALIRHFISRMAVLLPNLSSAPQEA